MNLSTYGRTPWTSDNLVARPLPTQGNTTYRDEDKHPCLKQDSNPWSRVRALKARASDRTTTGSTLFLMSTYIFNLCKILNVGTDISLQFVFLCATSKLIFRSSLRSILSEHHLMGIQLSRIYTYHHTNQDGNNIWCPIGVVLLPTWFVWWLFCNPTWSYVTQTEYSSMKMGNSWACSVRVSIASFSQDRATIYR
jgi:hypothetical protein